MSIAEIQKRRAFEEIARALYATGEKPRLIDILSEVSKYFSRFPAGQALPIPDEYIRADYRSDVNRFNEALARFTLNLEVLYESSLSQVDEIMTLSTLLRTHLERLRAKRKRLENKINDYLFSLYNTDGYYYSASDTFADLTLVDLNLTSAFIDIAAGSITIPTISTLTKRVNLDHLGAPVLEAFVNETKATFETRAPFSGAIDGLTNTVWSTEVETTQPSEVVMTIKLNVASQDIPVKISRIEVEPYGIVPVQGFVQIVPKGANSILTDFGGVIDTSQNKMVFIDTPTEIESIVFTFRKTEADYTTSTNNLLRYRYIFGAKDITITEHVYDNEAKFVSTPFSIPEELTSDNVIDAVSIVTQDEKPADADIVYYIAADVVMTDPQLSDFDWKRIEPINPLVESSESVVGFNGATFFVKYIRPNPLGAELQLIPFDTTNVDLTKRNPSPVILPDVDAYRIASFTETFLPDSLKLEEGVNSTRILHINYQDAAVDSLAFWTDYVNGVTPATTIYGRIDTGNEFFYGGDVGQSGRSVFVETYLETTTEQELILKEFRKIDPNSKTWEVKVFLNGREVGNLPADEDRLVIPWKFQQGLNHICLLINIPPATESHPNSYIGTLDLFTDEDLHNFGLVKLATWNYVDVFKMQYNETGEPSTFTVHNGEIISRRRPTTNFRIKYARPTEAAPNAVRLRADLSRSLLNPHVSPMINSYRIKFLYGERD